MKKKHKRNKNDDDGGNYDGGNYVGGHHDGGHHGVNYDGGNYDGGHMVVIMVMLRIMINIVEVMDFIKFNLINRVSIN